ncbi:MAG: hypothetical protein KAS66_00190 [Candidatus Omnitrophica bacterium]|nr:hypothetical protein [Candidatus Omnitrophota bacterium]
MIVLILNIVMLSVMVGLYLNALRGPFVRITTTTTLTDSGGGLSDLSPGDKITWVDPFTGIEKGAFVKAIEDNNTVTTPPPFIIHDEIAPWPPEGKQADIPHHSITELRKKIPVVTVDIPGDVSFSEFTARIFQAITNDLGLPPHHIGIGKQYRGRHYRRGAPDLTIIEGGKGEKG